MQTGGAGACRRGTRLVPQPTIKELPGKRPWSVRLQPAARLAAYLDKSCRRRSGTSLPFDEAGEHLDDADQEPPTMAMRFGRHQAASRQQLENGRAFRRAAAGDREECALSGPVARPVPSAMLSTMETLARSS